MTRIEKKILFPILACLISSVLIVSIFILVVFMNFSGSIFEMHTASGETILEGAVTSQIDRMKTLHETMDTSGVLAEIYSSGNTADADTYWNTHKKSEYDFAAIYNNTGNILWTAGDFNLSDVETGEYSGVVLDTKAGLTIQVCSPVYIDNTQYGFALYGMNMVDTAWLDEVKAEINSEVTIFNMNKRYSTTVLNDDGTRAVGTLMSAAVERIVIDAGQEYSGEADILGQNHYVNYKPMLDINGNVVGAFFAGYSSAESDSTMTTIILITVAVVVVIAVISILIVTRLLKKIIIAPIKEAELVADYMSKGELDVEDSKFKFGNDEIGDFVRALEKTKHDLSNYINDMGNVLAAMGKGDFSKQPELIYNGSFIQIKESFTAINRELNVIIGRINASSADVMSGSTQIAEGSQMLANGTTKQAAAIQELSAAIAEITDQVNNSADNAKKATEITARSAEKITRQNNEIKDMLSAMNDIKTKSDEISDIISAIDDIAFQTNILALNAAVEAARAGEAGKGFAVVADEVRNLAAKSAESAKQTGILINAAIEAVKRGTVIAKNTSDTMREVTALSDDTNLIIGDIADAANQQAQSIMQIKSGIDQISSVVQQNSATAEETAASCEELSGQSSMLKEQVDTLKV